MTRPILLAVAALAAASGCAQKSALYHWGPYDDTLYAHYKHPDDREAFVAGLKTMILEAEQRGEKVPPGGYAEYGYALYEEGQYPLAVTNFKKERELWPESRVLMEKMIRNAERKAGSPAKTPARGPAGALQRSSP
jgi:hypothetical protein